MTLFQLTVSPSLYAQYYFELRDQKGRPWIHPGFRQNLSDQPYYLVRQA